MLIRRRNTSRKAASHCSNGVAAKSIAHVVIQSVAWESPKQERILLERLSKTALVLAISTAQRIFAIKTRRINNQAAVSQDYLLGEGALRAQTEDFKSIFHLSLRGATELRHGNPA